MKVEHGSVMEKHWFGNSLSFLSLGSRRFVYILNYKFKAIHSIYTSNKRKQTVKKLLWNQVQRISYSTVQFQDIRSSRCFDEHELVNDEQFELFGWEWEPKREQNALTLIKKTKQLLARSLNIEETNKIWRNILKTDRLCCVLKNIFS